MTSSENHNEPLKVDKISHLTDQEQCDAIADEFSEIPNLYSPLHKNDIDIPEYFESEIPQFSAAQAWKKTILNENKQI